jgi:copper(I)-binding protein
MKPQKSARVVLASLCGALGVAWAANAHSQVVIQQAWIRSTAPGQAVAAAYMEIRSSTHVTLARASTPLARSAELHQTSTAGDVVSMRGVAHLDLPAGKTVSLRPGGYHLMLEGIAKPLVKGDVVPLTLVFEQKDKPAQTVEVKAEVRDLMASHGRHKMD